MKVYLDTTSSPDLLKTKIAEALEWIGANQLIRPHTRVFIKPNLTWRTHVPGVTTSPAFIEAAVAAIRERSSRVTVGEADGGYHSFSAEEAFASHNLPEIKKRYDVNLVNLSHDRTEIRRMVFAGKEVSVELPRLLLNDIDLLVSLPVPKMHAMTGVSLAFKNQWGCLPGTMRLRNHPEFARKILAINKLCQSRIAVYDGTYFLDKTGPMIGDAVSMNLLLAANDLGAGDLVCCTVMGISPQKVAHLRLAQNEGMMPRSLSEIAVNRQPMDFKKHQFTLNRSLINYLALLAFHSHAGTRLFYDSAAAGPVHRVLYAIRANPLAARILYGRIGPPKVHGRH